MRFHTVALGKIQMSLYPLVNAGLGCERPVPPGRKLGQDEYGWIRDRQRIRIVNR